MPSRDETTPRREVAVRSHRETSETWLPRGEHFSHLMNCQVGDRVRLRRGDLLFSQGDVDQHFYVLLAGKMHVCTLSEEGQESILNIMGPGSLIGEAAALTSEPRYSSAWALEPSLLLRLKVDDMEAYVAQDPKFAVALYYVFGIKQRQLVGRLKQTVNDRPDQRILRLLREVASCHARPGRPSPEVEINLTHEQIGNLTDLARVTVTRALGRLKEEGFIDLVGRRILIKQVLPETIEPQPGRAPGARSRAGGVKRPTPGRSAARSRLPCDG